ncbi:MAG TPA: DUF4180 domain-containing protein [Bryobacteraceae bacterium]|jgi:hypothetical protein
MSSPLMIVNGVIEGSPDTPLMHRIQDVSLVIEACFSAHVTSALLYPANLTSGFFDLSTREAGEILQKLRQYRVRLAVVCVPGAVQYSTMFGEMAIEEARIGHFRIFESPDDARAWLAR